MAMKITLDLAALKHVVELGGSEFVLELRNGILAEAVRTYLKGAAMDSLRSEARRIAKEIVIEEIGIAGESFRHDASLGPKLLARIERDVRQSLHAQAGEVLSGAMSGYGADIERRISGSLDALAAKYTEARVGAEIERRWALIRQSFSGI